MKCLKTQAIVYAIQYRVDLDYFNYFVTNPIYLISLKQSQVEMKTINMKCFQTPECAGTLNTPDRDTVYGKVLHM